MAEAIPHVLVSGAGIAGLVLAYWLLRAGYRVTIVERDPELRVSGQSIDIRQAAVEVIQSMGLERSIRDKCTNERGIAFVDSNGRMIAEFGATGSTEVQGLTSEYEILRGDLTQVFFDAVKDHAGIDFVFGDYVTGTKQSANGSMEVSFANRTGSAGYDLVVAADGLGSKLRRMLFTGTQSAEFRSLSTFSAYFTIATDFLKDSQGFAKVHQMTHGRSMLLRPDPAGHTRVTLTIVTATDDKEEQQAIKSALYEGNDSFKKLIQERFADGGWVVSEVVQEMMQTPDFYCSEIAQVVTDHLHKDGVVLLGDAGYCPTPISGMGTSLAIIGAYILAGEIALHHDDLSAAADRYQTLMLPLIKKAQKLPPGAPQIVNPQTQWGLNMANTVLGWVSWTRLYKLVGLAISLPAFSKGTFKLPDYRWREL